MAKATAIHPDYFKDFRAAQVVKEPTTTDEAEKEEVMFADFAETGTWNYLKKYILDLTDVIDSLVDTSMESGASYEEIGQRTIAAKIAKSFLVRVIEKVEDARTAQNTTKGG